MNKLTNRKQVNRLVFLFACTYMVSYITRINFGAVLSEILTDTQIPKTQLSIAVTGSFITYGLGQVVSGILGDRISPKKLISLGLTVTILMNLLIPLCSGPYQMGAVWCVNGFAQSFMFPPLVRLMTALLSEEDYKIATTKVSWGSSVGTILVYLLAPLVISVSSWRWVFVFCACAGIVMLFIWNRYCYEIEKEPPVSPDISTGKGKFLFSPLMLGIMFAVVLQGMLRDGISTWMPTYIAEVYDMGNVVSILTGVVLPLFSIVSFQAATQLHTKKLSNPLACAAVFFTVASGSALALYLFAGWSAALSVVLSALLTGCMHGVNLMLVCMIPPYFKRYGNISTVSGMINACTYVGSAVSIYGIAALSEGYGWSFTFFTWFLITLAGMAICWVSTRPWKRTYMQTNSKM